MPLLISVRPVVPNGFARLRGGFLLTGDADYISSRGTVCGHCGFDLADGGVRVLARVWCRFETRGRRRDTKMFTLASALFEGGDLISLPPVGVVVFYVSAVIDVFGLLGWRRVPLLFWELDWPERRENGRLVGRRAYKRGFWNKGGSRAPELAGSLLDAVSPCT